MIGVFAVTAGLKPRYKADATILLDTRTEHVSDVKSVESGPLPVGVADPAVARSEVKILQSPLIAERVIDQLDLSHNPDFQSHPGAVHSLLQLAGLASTPPPVSPQAARQRLVDEYERRLNVFNDGRSFTFTVSFEAGDPALAAAIVNAHAALYLADQQALKRDANQQEAFAAALRHRGRTRGTAMCVGASVDFLVGAQKRAPLIVQKMRLEWMHRLASDPRRLWRRYLYEGPRVLWWYFKLEILKRDAARPDDRKVSEASRGRPLS